MALAAIAEKKKVVNLSAVLASATKEKKSDRKSDVPILQPSEDIRDLASKLRAVYEELESVKSIYDTYQAQLIEAVQDAREKLCRAEYHSSIKIPDTSGLSVMLNWKHAYSKIATTNEETLREIVLSENYDKFFQTEIAIEVKDVSEQALTELIEAVGAAKFAEYFSVSQHIAPTKRYTEDYYREFTPEQRQQLEGIVKQYKPALKVR